MQYINEQRLMKQMHLDGADLVQFFKVLISFYNLSSFKQIPQHDSNKTFILNNINIYIFHKVVSNIHFVLNNQANVVFVCF